MLSNPLIITALLFAALGLVFLIATIIAVRKKQLFRTALYLVTALLMLSLTALCSTISIAIQGYRALTREDLAATVTIEPTGQQQFVARFSMPDGSQKIYALAGDELYIDAHILKWKPIANILGLHTSYELDRVAGRYTVLSDETTKAHTIYSLSKEKPVDLFYLRQRFAMLNPLLDAEYGSATFIKSDTAEEFNVMVSTTGLLIRKKENDQKK